MYGLKESQIKSIQSIFANYDQVDKVLLYGSRAKGNYKTASDIDMTLMGEDLDLTMLMRIENELDDLLLPHKIDLSIYSKIDNPELIDHINRVGEIFYSKDE